MVAGSAAAIAVLLGVLFLVLRPGSEDDAPAVTAATTSSAVPATTTSTARPTTTTSTAALVLEEDGLGVVDFGDDGNEAVATLTEILGPPDTSDPGQFEPCAGGTLSFTQWGPLGIEVVMSDAPRLVSYYYGSYDGSGPTPTGEPLATTDGITIGSTVADLRAAYGSDVEIEDVAELGGPVYNVTAFGDPADNIHGTLTGLTDEDTVLQVAAGGSGCD